MPTLSASMNLTIPTVSQTPGPEWASNINTSLSLIDSHDHSSGRGVPVTPAGMSISEDLPFQNHAAIQLSRATFTNRALTNLSLTPVSTYVAGGNLYYNDDAGNQIPITANGSVAAAAGNISGMTASQSVNYNAGTYSFVQDITGPTAGVIRGGRLSLVGVAPASANAIILQPPATFSDYNLTLPPNVPAAQSVMTMSSSGVVTNAAVDSTLTLTSSLLKVASSGITATQLANNAVTTAKILNANVTQAKLGPKTVASSSDVASATTTSTSQVAIPGLSVSINARSGYAIKIEAMPTGAGSSYIQVSAPSGANIDILWSGNFATGTASSFPVSAALPVNSMSAVFVPAANAVYTFSANWFVNVGGTSAGIYNVKLIAYEI